MAKRLQNTIAESRFTLPFMAVYAFMIWLSCGLLSHHWWLQFGCYAIITYLMVELNTVNVLIRIFSRMVSATFLALSCCACFLFPSLRELAMLLFITAGVFMLFFSYQDKNSGGLTFYAFFFFGLATMAYVHLFFFLPMMWILMLTNVLSLSWRTWAASLIGLATPYWFGSLWLIYQGDATLYIDHFSALLEFEEPFNLAGWMPHQKVTLAIVVLQAIIGTVHCIRKSFLDKIRTRLFYGFFIWAGLAALVFAFLQPQHYNAMMLIMIASTAPLIAHYFALTSTKFTNYVFMAITGSTFILTLVNIWITLSLY